MGARGPARKPPELCVSWRANPKYKGSNGYKTPKPKKGEPPIPYGLSEGAQQVWQEVAPSLLRMRVLSVEDGVFLEAFCETTAAWRDCRDFVTENGFSEETAAGRRKRPEADMFSKLLGEMVRMSNLLGLNPSARTTLQVTPIEEPPDDEAGKKRAAIKKNFNGLVPEET